MQNLIFFCRSYSYGPGTNLIWSTNSPGKRSPARPLLRGTVNLKEICIRTLKRCSLQIRLPTAKHHSSSRLPLQVLPPAAKILFKDNEDAESYFSIFEVTPTGLGQISFGARIKGTVLPHFVNSAPTALGPISVDRASNVENK